MAQASRVGVDSAGGTITGALQALVSIDGVLWAVLGAAVASHGSGSHASATMAQGSALVSIDGVPACIAGNAATCGDTSTGSGPVSADS